MNLEQAINTAIEYENKVHATYAAAADETDDPIGKRVFGVLAREELEHVEYLQSCLKQWQQQGKLTQDKLGTALPSPEVVERGIKQLEQTVEKKHDPRPREVELLRRAIKAEMETSAFYKKMVQELGQEGELFARFVEIEEGHLAMVSAELDSVSGMGYWFDMPEWQFQDG